MRAGVLNEIIKVLRLVKTRNDFGEQEEHFEVHLTTRAAVSWRGGTRTVENDEKVYNYTKEFTVRSYVDIVETDIIEWQGARYRIISIEHRRGYNGTIIFAELINV